MGAKHNNWAQYRVSGEFFQAEIQNDGIISCKWLADHKIAVFPHRNCLLLEDETLLWLRGENWTGFGENNQENEENTQEKSSGKKSVQAVTKMENEVQHLLQAEKWKPDNVEYESTENEISDESTCEKFQVHKVMALEEIKQWNLKPTNDPKETNLEEDELEEIAIHMAEVEMEINLDHNLDENAKRVHNIIECKDLLEGNPQAEEIKKKIVEEYTGSVFRDEIWPDPPERGPFGLAKLQIKPGVVPVKQRPFVLIGERREALTKLVTQFEKQGLLENAMSPWLSSAFPVPKKRTRVMAIGN